MKFYAIIIFCVFLISCSRKSHVLNKVQTSSSLQTTSDSTRYQNLLSRDKSIITTITDLDTSITLKRQQLSGSLNWGDSVGHFENSDLTIDFEKDKSGANINFQVSAKSKTINARYHQQTITQNDIVKIKGSKLDVQKETRSHQDSVYSHVSDKQDPASATNSIKSLIIWIAILLVITATVVIILKKKII